jgi:hypothetical protein
VSAVEAIEGFEQALTMDHGKDVDFILSQLVDEALAVEESLAHVGVGEFRHDASELGMRGQFVGKVEQAFDDLLGVIGGIPADVFGVHPHHRGASFDQIRA